jgi:hypothetical protein
MPLRRLLPAAALALSCSLAAPAAAQAPATPPPVPAGVLTTLTVKPGVQRADVMRVMVEEARHTLALHLDGRILQWWGLGDGRGVVFVLKGATVEDAKAITDTLPLTKAGLVDFQYVPLTTITPLRILLAAPGAAPR